MLVIEREAAMYAIFRWDNNSDTERLLGVFSDAKIVVDFLNTYGPILTVEDLIQTGEARCGDYDVITIEMNKWIDDEDSCC
jgi:hypothetical protein